MRERRREANVEEIRKNSSHKKSFHLSRKSEEKQYAPFSNISFVFRDYTHSTHQFLKKKNSSQ